VLNLSRRPIDAKAKKALEELKYEITKELGITYNNKIDRGNISSRSNGYLGGNLGGNMTRKLVEMAEKQLINRKEY